MKALDLPTDLLRAFVCTCQLGSVTRAAERLGRTQPAISLQLRRLEHAAGQPLLRRHGRRLTLAPAGEVLLEHAVRVLEAHDAAVAALSTQPLPKRLRVGVVQDVADTALALALGRFARLHRQMRLDVRVAGSVELRRLIAEDELDVAVCAGAGGDVILPMRWIGEPDLARLDPLPLALLDPPCGFRDAALAALERSGRAWRIAVSGPSLSGLRAAVAAGLGLTCRCAVALPGLPVLTGLPALGEGGFQVIEGNALAAPLTGLLRQELKALADQDVGQRKGPPP